MIKNLILCCGILSASFLILLFCLALIVRFTQTSFYHGPISTHFDGKKFFNPPPYATKNFLDILRWSFQNNKQKWPTHVENTAHPDLSAPKHDEIKTTFVNHATVLIQTEKLTLLTDPIWSKRASPFSWYGPRRVRKPGIAFHDLPKIDVVLISHNHYDHLDIPTLQKLEKAFHPVFLVPLGDQALLQRYGMTHIVELDWWQTHHINQATITFLPTQHWSARWTNDKCATLWGSYGIEVANKKIYFAGDTGYSKHFTEIKQQWGRPDLAFLPIGSYLPEWFMQENHMNPGEAVQAHQDLDAKKSIAIHFGTFQLSDEGIDKPVEDLQKALTKTPTPSSFLILQVGETHLM